MKVFAGIQIPGKLLRLEAQVPVGSTVKDVLTELQVFPSQECGLSIFGLKCTCETIVNPGDRIEVSLPLQVDPKTARRLRAERNGQGQTKARRHANAINLKSL